MLISKTKSFSTVNPPLVYNIRSSCLSACQQARTSIFQEVCENPTIFVVMPRGSTVNFAARKINVTWIIIYEVRVCRLAGKHERAYFKKCAKILRFSLRWLWGNTVNFHFRKINGTQNIFYIQNIF